LYFGGYVAFAHVPKETRTKLDAKGVKRIFIEEVKGYKLYNLINQCAIINSDVIFYECINFNMEKMVSRLDSSLK
jgi:hypothetical protein